VVVNERPLAGVAAAARRLSGDGAPIGPHEAITIREGLLAYTAGGARLSGDADRFGTMDAGQFADLVVLDRCPLTTPLEELADIQVTMTFVGGEVVYEK
jgi:predicted amidohydrolase YtcJ